jgi:hypothetical protein
MVYRTLVTALFVVAVLPFAMAQHSPGPDETEIRALVRREDAGQRAPRTQDSIFWSGAWKRPTVGAERREAIPGPREPANRVLMSERTKTIVRRIEVAKSGDLAYEFNDSELSFDLRMGEHVSFPRSSLRVWKKEGGAWKIAAEFHRPHYRQPPSAAASR